MSKISILVNSTVNNSGILALKNYTQQSIAQINQLVGSETPVFEALLFQNNHKEVADNLLNIIAILQTEKVKFQLYELADDEIFDKNTHQLHEISTQTLVNILDSENYE